MRPSPVSSSEWRARSFLLRPLSWVGRRFGAIKPGGSDRMEPNPNSGLLSQIQELLFPGRVVDRPPQERRPRPLEVVEFADRRSVARPPTGRDLVVGEVDRLAAEVQREEGAVQP